MRRKPEDISVNDFPAIVIIVQLLFFFIHVVTSKIILQHSRLQLEVNANTTTAGTMTKTGAKKRHAVCVHLLV